ncbi:MAG: ATP-dependent DNA helicase RecG [Flammeovirgaceae bacterium]|nr:ATP-dependent DNA helicase RecG [Flammeovirgaceae bacterium]
MPDFFESSIEFLKGVGPQRAALLQKELHISTFGDLLTYYPFRYDDRTTFYKVNEVNEELPSVQLQGKILRLGIAGGGRKKRLVGTFRDDTGDLDLVWFQGIKWTLEKIKPGVEYIVFGKPNRYGSRISIAHPEIEPVSEKSERGGYLQPVYPLTEILRSKYFDNKVLGKLQAQLQLIGARHITETLPQWLIEKLKMVSRMEALSQIHFPADWEKLKAAQYRLKFEELFYLQIQLIRMKLVRQQKSIGFMLSDTSLLTKFYKEHLPFELTDAQKKVIREIYTDMKAGQQMNRLLQGDVGSGKTIVAFISILIAVGSGFQAALMAPTEILAQQHYTNLKKHADKMGITIALLSGSTKKAVRKTLHEELTSGRLNILIGTHALIEEEVKFHQLGLAIIDEQHRFGVSQRSKLWQKNEKGYPHVLVMTATPIPRTLAMTLYGDLDISVIDELPKGRKPIKTTHRYDSHRLQLNQFLREQIKEGRQIYIVYPLIEESEKLDLKHLMDGYESISRAFPDVPLSILHGKMKAEAKDFEMDRFIRNETKIMVATTVIEVGVDVPNASVMVIESAERFGLSQLHQLRGRVGRGASQSYCILVSSYKLSKESKVRMETMVKTNNGFDIAETDLRLRGPGDLLGTQQSGLLDLSIADLSKDGKIIKLAREIALRILDQDPELKKGSNLEIKKHLESKRKKGISWSKVS